MENYPKLCETIKVYAPSAVEELLAEGEFSKAKVVINLLAGFHESTATIQRATESTQRLNKLAVVLEKMAPE